MEQVKVSDDEGAQEPITYMHRVIMVEITIEVFPGELTIIVIGVLAFGDFLI